MQAGICFSIIGLCAAFVQGVLIRFLIPALGEGGCIYFGTAMSAVTYGIMGFIDNTWMMYAILPFSSLGSVTMPAVRAQLTKKVSEKNQQGRLQGSLASLCTLSKVVGPLVTTGAFGYMTSLGISFLGLPFLLCCVLDVMAVVMLCRIELL